MDPYQCDPREDQIRESVRVDRTFTPIAGCFESAKGEAEGQAIAFFEVAYERNDYDAETELTIRYLNDNQEKTNVKEGFDDAEPC